MSTTKIAIHISLLEKKNFISCIIFSNENEKKMYLHCRKKKSLKKSLTNKRNKIKFLYPTPLIQIQKNLLVMISKRILVKIEFFIKIQFQMNDKK